MLMKVLNYKPSIIKSTGQVKINLKKKSMSKQFLKDLPKIKSIKMGILSWDCDGS
jgi:hypothetical protein